MPGRATLPLLAFQHHVGPLYVDPSDLRFICELGVGELALVEHGQWIRNGQPAQAVVVKGYKPHVIATPEDFRELLLEANKLKRLQHPHLCRFIGLGCFQHGTLAEVRSSIFMVEEYVGLRNLRKLLSEQGRVRVKNLYSMRTALRWAQQLALVLAYLHGCHPAYIHGDVKADNVFLTDGHLPKAEVRLGDLKPHRYIYDKVPCTLSQHLKVAPHQQQQSSQQFSLRRYSDQTIDTSQPVDAAADVADAAAGSRQYIAYGGTVLPLPQGAVSTTNGSCDASLMGHAKSNPMPIQSGSSKPVHWHGSGFVVTAGEDCEKGPEHRSMGSNFGGNLGTSMGASASVYAEDLEDGGRHREVLLRPSKSLPFDELSRAEAATVTGNAVGDGYGCASRRVPHESLTAAATAETEAEAPGVGVYQRHGSAGARLSDSASTVERGMSPAAEKPGEVLVNGSGHWANRSQKQSFHQQLGDEERQQQHEQEQCLHQQPAVEQHQQALVHTISLAIAVADDHGGGMVRRGSALASAASGEEQVHGELLYQHSNELRDFTSTEGSLSVHSSFGELPESNNSGSKGIIQQLLNLGGRGQQEGEEHLQRLSLQLQQERPEAGDGGGAANTGRRGAGAEAEEEAPVTFDLTATGAANPSGLPQSALLDLFADLAGGSEPDARMALEQPSYISTIAPGSNVQQRLLDAPVFSKRGHGELEAHSSGMSSRSSHPSPSGSSSSSKAVSLLSEGLAQRALARCNSPSGALHQFSSYQSEGRGSYGEAVGEKSAANGESVTSPAALGCTGHAGNPTVMEAKQHGGSSALQALTAIDSIREESSSIADSGMLAAEGLMEEGEEEGAEDGAPGSRGHSGSMLGVDAGTVAAGGDMHRLDSSRGSTGHEGSSWSSLLTGLLLGRSTSDGEVGLAGGDDGSTSPAAAATAAGACKTRSKPELDGAGDTSASRHSSGSSSVSMWALEDEAVGGTAAGVKELGDAAVVGGRSGGSILKSTSSVERNGPLASTAAVPRGKLSPTGSFAGDGTSKIDDLGAAGRLPLKSPFDCSNESSDPDRSVKRVRFTVERPAGLTASRDRSLLYTAPELMQGHRATIKVDVFAFGILLYELLSRSLLSSWQPYVGDDESGCDEARGMLRFAQQMADGYRPPIPAHWPEPVAELVTSCWAAEAHERPSMEEVEKQLLELGHNSKIIAALDNFVLALADWERAAPSCGCTCVIS